MIHSRLLQATSVGSRVAIVLEDGSGVAIDWVTGRSPLHEDGSTYSQANVRAGKVMRLPIRALPSVIVDTEKVLREADGPVESGSTKSLLRVERWSPRGAPRNRAIERVRSPKTRRSYVCYGFGSFSAQC